jgi:hypothetical protein
MRAISARKSSSVAIRVEALWTRQWGDKGDDLDERDEWDERDEGDDGDQGYEKVTHE